MKATGLKVTVIFTLLGLMSLSRFRKTQVISIHFVKMKDKFTLLDDRWKLWLICHSSAATTDTTRSLFDPTAQITLHQTQYKSVLLQLALFEWAISVGLSRSMSYSLESRHCSAFGLLISVHARRDVSRHSHWQTHADKHWYQLTVIGPCEGINITSHREVNCQQLFPVITKSPCTLWSKWHGSLPWWSLHYKEISYLLPAFTFRQYFCKTFCKQWPPTMTLTGKIDNRYYC